jgi:hypothetical protein
MGAFYEENAAKKVRTLLFAVLRTLLFLSKKSKNFSFLSLLPVLYESIGYGIIL